MGRISSISLLWKILSFHVHRHHRAVRRARVDRAGAVRAHRVVNLEEEVRVSFQAYESLWRARADQLASVSLVLSRMPDVRAAFSTGDQATIRDTAGEIWEKISQAAARCFSVTDPRGRGADVAGRRGRDRRCAIFRRCARRRLGSRNRQPGFLLQGDRMYQIVITPVYVAAAA